MFCALALVLPEPDQVHGNALLPGFGPLAAGDIKRLVTT
jgi:hypothetical protein